MPSELSPVARAAIRGVVQGAVLAAVIEAVAVFIWLTHGNYAPPISRLVMFAVVGLVTGLIFAPLAWIEIAFASRPPSPARDRRAEMAAFAAAIACLFVALVEMEYLDAGLGDPERGIGRAAEVVRDVVRFDADTALGAAWFIELAAPIAAVARQRVRGASVPKQILGALGLWVPATGLFAVLVALVDPPPSDHERVIAGSALGLAALLPPVYRLVDRIERRVAARLARDAERG